MRLDIDNSVDLELKRLQLDIDELKNKQFTGYDNLLTYFVESDTDIIKSSISPFGDATWLITFNPNSGVKTYNFLEVRGTITNGTGFEAWSWFTDPLNVSQTADTVWRLYFFNDSNSVDVQFEVGFKTIEQGTVTWQEI